MRNFDTALTQGGFHIVLSCAETTCGREFFNQLRPAVQHFAKPEFRAESRSGRGYRRPHHRRKGCYGDRTGHGRFRRDALRSTGRIALYRIQFETDSSALTWSATRKTRGTLDHNLDLSTRRGGCGPQRAGQSWRFRRPATFVRSRSVQPNLGQYR